MAPPKIQANSFAALPVGAKIFALVLGLALITAGYYFGLHMGLEEETGIKLSEGELHQIRLVQDVVDAINRSKPSVLKGVYVKSLSISTTISPGITLGVAQTIADASDASS